VELRVGKPVKIADVVVDCESAAAVRAYAGHKRREEPEP